MILLSMLLCRSCIWENSCSWVITRKAFKQLDCRIVWSHIFFDEMTGSQWRIARRRKNISTKFPIGCSALKVLKSCSLTKISIELKIKWKEETFHAFSSQLITASHFVQSDCNFYWSAENLQGSLLLFLSLYHGRCQDETSVEEIWDIGTFWNWCKIKVIMMLSPFIKNAYLEIF